MNKLMKTRQILGIMALSLALFPINAFASGGMTPSGGGKYVVGDTITITVNATGATFNALQGTISASGPVSVISFAAGSFNVFVGSVANGQFFAGTTTSATTSLRVATIKLRATKEGTGSVTVSGVRLANAGQEVGTTGGSVSFSIGRAPTPPGGVDVSSPTHPDQSVGYTATSVEIDWKAPLNGASGYSYVWDDKSDTIPAQTINTTATSIKFDNVPVGVHYFHIRALNGDGWGGTTHFTVNIKEPDPTVNNDLNTPVILSIEKTGSFTTDINNGTVSGLLFKGKGPVGYKINLTITPSEHFPADINKTVDVSEAGEWQWLIDKPMLSGFYTVTAQGQQDKTLTPISQPFHFETSVAMGGTIHVITTSDAKAPLDTTVKVLGVTLQNKDQEIRLFLMVLALLVFLSLITGGLWYQSNRKRR